MNTEAAAARDAALKPVLETMWELPYREIAEELTNRNIPTPRGGDLWNAMTVMRVMKRLGIAGQMNGSLRDVTLTPAGGKIPRQGKNVKFTRLIYVEDKEYPTQTIVIE